MTFPARRTLAFGAGILFLIAALTVVSRNTKPPRLPEDPAHKGLTANASCRPCHGQGASSPLKRGHPPKDDCLHCHRIAAQ
jgi:hypothetical protein